MSIKHPIKSWTLWLNAAGLALLAGLVSAEKAIVAFAHVIPNELYAALSFALIVGNSMIRALRTNSKLSLDASMDDADEDDDGEDAPHSSAHPVRPHHSHPHPRPHESENVW